MKLPITAAHNLAKTQPRIAICHAKLPQEPLQVQYFFHNIFREIKKITAQNFL
jgi:hypothetical protein